MTKPLILVAGGMGYIGSHTVVELINAGYEALIVDNLSNSNLGVLDGIDAITGKRPEFIKADCADLDAMRSIFASHPASAGVIDFAASKAVNESVHKPLLYYRNNIVSLLNLLECINGAPECRGIVFSSSCTVYGEPDTNPVTEMSPVKPATSPYGNTKQISEDIIRDTVAAGTGFNAILLRYFNPVGAHPSALIGELPNGVPQNLIPYLTQTAIGIRKQLSVFGDDYPTPDGSCIRDFIDINDLARAHVTAVKRIVNNGMDENVEVFNLGTGHGVSVLELINTFEKATGVKVPYAIAPRREGDIIQVWADPSKANTILGWKAETPLEQTMLNAWHWQQHLRETGVM